MKTRLCSLASPLLFLIAGCVADPALQESLASISSTDPIPAPTTPPSASPSPITTTGLDGEESAFVGLINTYRAQNGLSPLQVSAALTRSSKWMSTDMAAKDYFSHTDSLGRDPFARMAAFGYSNYTTAGENIAAGNASAANTFAQWKNSPPHNANMLGSGYRVIGVGRASGSHSAYGWYWTTDFGSTVDALLQ